MGYIPMLVLVLAIVIFSKRPPDGSLLTTTFLIIVLSQYIPEKGKTRLFATRRGKDLR
jgi:hypothetical protein